MKLMRRLCGYAVTSVPSHFGYFLISIFYLHGQYLGPSVMNLWPSIITYTPVEQNLVSLSNQNFNDLDQKAHFPSAIWILLAVVLVHSCPEV